jgi:hypothetical protein
VLLGKDVGESAPKPDDEIGELKAVDLDADDLTGSIANRHPLGSVAMVVKRDAAPDKLCALELMQRLVSRVALANDVATV